MKFVDNGKGIDDEDLKNVFVPFFSTKNAGTGVGLTIARQLIIAQGGSINIKSFVGKGTTVSIGFDLLIQ
jgi:signal transduction histidine kinase